MTSALQVLFMNPLFRKTVFCFNLYDKSLNNPDYNFISGHKHEILTAVQKLFTQLFLSNKRSEKTIELTKAFHWDTGEGRFQQDSKEFIELFLFDILEKIYAETEYFDFFKKLMNIKLESFFHCTTCQNRKSRTEETYDLIIPVKDITDIREGLSSMYGNNSGEIISDYFCENCNAKVDIQKGAAIISLPQYLLIALGRFEFDYNTLERVKLNSKCEFPLELNMGPYLNSEKFYEGENESYETNYELCSLIIHRGNAHSGHYFSYIRDELNEGGWDLPLLDNYIKEPEIQTQAYNANNKNDASKKTNNKNEEDEVDAYEAKEDDNTRIDNNNPNNKKNNKQNKNKQNNKQNNNKQNNNKKNNKQNNNKQNNNKQNTKISKEDEEYFKYSFDKCDFPLPYDNKELAKNWFCFDDENVFPIRVGRLQKQFKSSESAFLLFYKRKDVSLEQSFPPLYFKELIMKENLEREEHKKKYDTEEKSLMINVHNASKFYFNENDILQFQVNKDISSNVSNKCKLLEDQFDNDAFSVKMQFEDKLEDVVNNTNSMGIYNNIEENKVISIYKIINSTLKLRRSIKENINDKQGNNTTDNAEDNDEVIQNINIIEKLDYEKSKKKTINELNITHNSHLLIIQEDNYNEFKEKIDNKYTITKEEKDLKSNEIVISEKLINSLEPYSIKVIYNNKEYFIERYSIELYDSFKQYIIDYFNIKINITSNSESQEEHNNAPISLYFDNNSKKISLDHIAYDSKKQEYLSLKQLKLNERIIIVSKSSHTSLKNKDAEELVDSENMINIFARCEENEDDVVLLPFYLNKTFKELRDLLLSTFKIEENVEIRIRKDLDHKIIFIEDLNKTLNSDPVFVEDGVRLLIEKGENYKSNEFLLKVLIDEAEEKLPTYKEFICVAETKLETIKNVIAKTFELNIVQYKFFRVNWCKEPVKELKNESLSLSTLKINDGDYLYLKSNAKASGISYVKFYFDTDKYNNLLGIVEDKVESKITENNGEKVNIDIKAEDTTSLQVAQDNELSLALSNIDIEDKNKLSLEKQKEIEEFNDKIKDLDYVFKPIKDNQYKFCLEFIKENKVKDIKESLLKKLKSMHSNDALNKLTEENIRLRIISTRNEVQTILPNNASIKSLNLFSPITLFVEILEEKELQLTNKQIELVLFKRDIINKSYNKISTNVFTFTDALTTSFLYEEIEKMTQCKNFSLAKYFKADYKWERIVNDGDNLKKNQFNLKDGDFIAYRDEDELEALKIKDNLQTKEDEKMISYMKIIGNVNENSNNKNSKGKKGRGVERAIRLKLDE